ncbi:MAG: IS30 family transposase [Streptosporangiaceae bacterium]
MRRRPLTMADREEISRGLSTGMEQKGIAKSIGRDESVVSREIRRHGGTVTYRAHRADKEAAGSRERPKCRKITADPELKERVVCDLRKGWSPQQISGRLGHDRCREETALSVSHEAIYTWIYALPKGELAAMDVALRTGRSRRQPRGRSRSKGARIVGMTSISQRPEEAEGRKVPGYWEGDLVIGKAGKTAMGTLVERKSRYFVPVALPDGRDSEAVCGGIIDSVKGMPANLLKSITWDQGIEMARHAALTLKTNIPVYFAHAHSPWERGTNENTNGLLREYFPKGTDITGDINYLNAVADELNGRPRAILGFRTPAEVFAELLLADDSGDNLSSIASTG